MKFMKFTNSSHSSNSVISGSINSDIGNDVISAISGNGGGSSSYSTALHDDGVCQMFCKTAMKYRKYL
jgi:hypothetical protein